jgi:FkbM family methyltransferase
MLTTTLDTRVVQNRIMNISDMPTEVQRRVRMTISCRDCDSIPKVHDAGDIYTFNDERVQIMHNGVRIIEGCYCGAWMTEIIRQSRGHHEPQEELAFHIIVERLRTDTPNPRMIELGAYWSYYSLWLLQRIPTASTYMVEPDPDYLEAGRRNIMLNGRKGTFLQAAVGRVAMPPSLFRCESDGVRRSIQTESLPSLFERFGLGHADIVLADIQGAEMGMLEGAAKLLDEKRVRFLVVSTHHHSISGDPLTHQHCLEFLKSRGAHIVAEHSIRESYSGDGLVAVSFDPRDDIIAEISYARARDSLYGEVEIELAHCDEQRQIAERRTAALESQLRETRKS